MIAGLLCFTAIDAQNLVINPLGKDLNTCCETGCKCRPEAWFSLAQSGGFFIKSDGKCYLSVNPIHHIYDVFPVHNCIALYEALDTSTTYILDIWLPGNDKVKMFYTIGDSSLLYADSSERALLKDIPFDSVMIRGAQEVMTFKPRQAGGFLIVKFQNPNRKIRTSYNQYIQSLTITPQNPIAIDMEAWNKRREQIYAIDRTYFFYLMCPDKTLVGEQEK